MKDCEEVAPCILVVHSNENRQYLIVAEKRVYLEASSLQKALEALFCMYYVYDMAYPKPLHSVFIFIQHFILKLVDNQRVPASVLSVQSAVTKLMK